MNEFSPRMVLKATLVRHVITLTHLSGSNNSLINGRRGDHRAPQESEITWHSWRFLLCGSCCNYIRVSLKLKHPNCSSFRWISLLGFPAVSWLFINQTVPWKTIWDHHRVIHMLCTPRVGQFILFFSFPSRTSSVLTDYMGGVCEFQSVIDFLWLLRDLTPQVTQGQSSTFSRVFLKL